MARYRVTALCYINDRILQDGEDVEVADDLIPGPHLSPRDDAARRAIKGAGARMTNRVDPIDSLTMPAPGAGQNTL
jgi:hypothetical protein